MTTSATRDLDHSSADQSRPTWDATAKKHLERNPENTLCGAWSRGKLILVRAVRSSDAASLRAFHARCSDETRYRRFFMHKPRLSYKEAEYFCSVDMRDRGAFVASDLNSPKRVHGIGHWDKVTDTRAEIAFVVEDDLQGLGIGRTLLNAVLDRTRALGLCQLTGFVLAVNGPMRHCAPRSAPSSGSTIPTNSPPTSGSSLRRTRPAPSADRARSPRRAPPTPAGWWSRPLTTTGATPGSGKRSSAASVTSRLRS